LRPQGHRSPSRARPQEALGLRPIAPDHPVKIQKTSSKPGRLSKRSGFLSVRNGEKRRGPLFLLETKRYEDDEPHGRYGLTVSKKCGNAVVRNRIRRRLNEAMRLHAAVDMDGQSDYVIVAPRCVERAVSSVGRRIETPDSRRKTPEQRCRITGIFTSQSPCRCSS
jgi:ribonuclease P protein component